MTHRSILELLNITRSYILDENSVWGLCLVPANMYNRTIITYDEYNILCKYLRDNLPTRKYVENDAFCWKPGSIRPRITWLNTRIELEELKELKKLEELEKSQS